MSPNVTQQGTTDQMIAQMRNRISIYLVANKVIFIAHTIRYAPYMGRDGNALVFHLICNNYSIRSVYKFQCKNSSSKLEHDAILMLTLSVVIQVSKT